MYVTLEQLFSAFLILFFTMTMALGYTIDKIEEYVERRKIPKKQANITCQYPEIKTETTERKPSQVTNQMSG